MNPKSKLLLGAVICVAVAGLDLKAADSPPAFKVEKRGHGSPVILIPGLASSGAVWDSTVAALEGKHECHVLTLAGFAGQPPITTPLIETASKELMAYIKREKLKEPAVIGHSLGGVMALYLAAHHGKELGPIVIVDSLPALGFSQPGATAEMAKSMGEEIGKQMAEAPKDDFVAHMKGFLDSMVAGEENQKKVGGWVAASDQKTVGACFTWIFVTDLRPELPKISNRTLVVAAGAKPGAIPEDILKSQYEGLKGVKIVRAEKAKHFIMFDESEFLNAQLKGFLDK